MINYTIKKNLKEVDDFFKSSIEPTIKFKNKEIFVTAIYSNDKKRPTSYTISLKNSNKYYYKCYTRREAKEKVKYILMQEWFKTKISINKKCNDLWINSNQLAINNIEKADKIYNKKKEINLKIQEKYKIENVYDEIWDFLDKLKFKFVHKHDTTFKGEEEYMIEKMYWSQSFCGSTDYKDHRKDTKEELLNLVKKSIRYSKGLQILHYINYQKWDFYDTIELIWEYWGWSANFLK